MKISANWVRDFVSPAATDREVAEALTVGGDASAADAVPVAVRFVPVGTDGATRVSMNTLADWFTVKSPSWHSTRLVVSRPHAPVAPVMLAPLKLTPEGRLTSSLTAVAWDGPPLLIVAL